MNRYSRVLAKLKDKGLTGKLAQGIGGGWVVKVVSALLALITTAILARTLGAEGFGLYSFAFSVAMLLAVPTQAGLPILVLREIAQYQVTGKWGLIRGLLHRSNQLAILLSLIIYIVALTIVSHFGSDPDNISIYAASFALIPLLAIGNVRGATLQGLSHVILGQLPESLFRPIALLICIGAIILTGVQLTPTNTMISHALASMLAVVLGASILRRKLPTPIRYAASEYKTIEWIKSLIPLSLLAAVQVINLQAGTILLGIFREDQDVGLYRGAFQIALMTVFVLEIVQNAAAPHIAKLHAAGNKTRLQLLIKNITRLTVVSAVPVVLMCVFYGKEILSTFYGDPFSKSYDVLVILVIGQFACAALGPTSHIMNMTRQEGETVRGVSLAAFVNIGLSLALIREYGAIGVAIASASSAIVLNSYLAIRAHTKLGIRCGPL